ncbi:MAG: serine/threonine protein kinase [Planctomycetes bacterium]|nr:serine/threonine protein kinase [Planctomycetota bacterium]
MSCAYCNGDVIQGPLGSYVIREVKGMGGQRVAYSALAGNVEVCIKCFNTPNLALAQHEKMVSDSVQRLRSRGDYGKLVAHVNPVQDVFQHRGDVFLVEPLRQGGSLAEQCGQALPVFTAAFIGRKLVRGIMALHLAGFIHRDIKPENILFGADAGELFVTDMSLAIAVYKQGLAAATPGYASPQQLRNLAASVADDVYSIGATLYQLIVGLRPFQCANPEEEVELTLDSSRPALPAAEFVKLPDMLNGLLCRALSKQPHERPTLREMHEELSRH